MEDFYYTTKEENQAEFVEKHSRFIGYCKPISTEQEAIDFINEKRKKHYDATHNVYAYSLKNDFIKRYSDDGEPKDTAGKPAYELIRVREIDNVAMVISRYFGGVKLGAGGLIRAYAAAAKLAIETAGTCEIIPYINFVVDTPYGKADTVERIVEENGGIIYEREYLETVVFRVKGVRECIEKVRELDNIVVIE